MVTSRHTVLGDIMERFVSERPVAVMTRALLENALRPEAIDALFAEHAQEQYHRELLFSTVVEVMGLVVCGMQPSVNAAYKQLQERIPVARKNLYEKINHTEPGVSAALLRHTASAMSEILQHLGGTLPPLVPGYRTKILDGNCLAATEHRIEELRTTAAGPLPGKALVVLDPAWMLAIDVFPCADGHAQERSLLGEVLPTVQAGDLWIEDRNFCTRKWLLGVMARQACFVVREHRANAPTEAKTGLTYRGQRDGADVYEQTVYLTDPVSGQRRKIRRLELHLAKPTRDGDWVVVLLTNLPSRRVSAVRVADLYRKRWTIETLFQVLEQSLGGEQPRLGYPSAALLCFCLALVAYNVLAVVKASLRAAHGVERVEHGVSLYYIALELDNVYDGMMIALPAPTWLRFGNMSAREIAAWLRGVAAQAKLARYARQPRGPKKPPPQRIKKKNEPHVSTDRILAQRKKAKTSQNYG